MAERKRVGLYFSYNERWIAGTYYILNIIHALKTLDAKELPEITIITEDKEAFRKVKEETGYPFLKYQVYPLQFPKYSVWERLLNSIGLRIFNKKFIAKTRQPRIDFLYPNEVEGISIDGLAKINWIPDFQELYLPEYFSEKEIEGRKRFYENVVLKGDAVTFSSDDSKKDFEKLFPDSDINKEVLPFAVTHPEFHQLNISKLLDQYKLPEVYFFVPNQFWIHKNHITVLRALNQMKEEGIRVHVAFSGKELDFRNQDHIDELKDYVSTHELEAQVHFLGFLERKVQLCLMNHARAILQPSLFEGWSTVVEDAKALNAYLILSNLDVHREQCNSNVDFFEPKDFQALATLLLKYSSVEPSIVKSDYRASVREFGIKFNTLVEKYSVKK